MYTMLLLREKNANKHAESLISSEKIKNYHTNYSIKNEMEWDICSRK